MFKLGKIGKLASAIVAVSLLSGCSVSSETSEFSQVIKEELGSFISSKEMLSCNVFQQCAKEIKEMVFSSQRIIKKFEALTPSAEVGDLVQETILAMTPVAESGFESACAFQTSSGTGDEVQCRTARLKIAGDKDFALQDVWKVLDAWQVYL